MAYLLQQLLAKTAARFPERTAVWAQGRTLTYQQLEEQSNQLAHLLRESGIRKGDRVGIYFPKAIESVVSMLGVLKAGGVYVPLDPQSPVRRIEYILENCGVKGLITVPGKFEGLSPSASSADRFTILLGDPEKVTGDSKVIPWNQITDYPHAQPPVCQTVETDLAYILYTSGSTGDPKGVMLSHRNALTFINWCAETFQIRPEDHLSNHAPLHFDLSVFDVYNSIKAGAAVYMIPEDIAPFPASLASFIETHGISVWYSVPSALVYLLLHGNLPRRNLAQLRLILFAGEPFAVKYLRMLAEVVPGAELYNLYGPTETNVCTYHRVDRSKLSNCEKLPIGKACSNTEVFAVNEADEPLKPGETGELLVRGPSVTYGYWHDTQKTAKAVLENRFQPHFSEKIYRTGDLVTIDENGDYYYMGRIDNMVKSRGYRIELGEIETALYSHSAVKETAVVAVPDDQLGNRIKAFVATNQPGMLTKADIQQHCAQRVPKYMIPELVEFCDSLPKTSTGKVDRKRLAQVGGQG